MYQQGHRRRTHRRLYGSLTVGLILVVAAAVVGAHYFLRANTHITGSPAQDFQVTVPSDNTARFTESTFSIALPTDWKATHVNETPQPTYSWENTTGNKGVETLDVFVDDVPTNFAINSVLPIEANGTKLVLAGEVSDNCTSFTGGASTSTADGYTAAKWDGVNFLCDVANYERDVVGTSSPQEINTVTVTGPSTGTHKYFFVYTDNSAEPDYTIFTDALQSFKAR